MNNNVQSNIIWKSHYDADTNIVNDTTWFTNQ